MPYNVTAFEPNLTSSEPKTVNVSWRIKNNDTQTLKVFSDVSIEGENVASYSETLGPGETFDYYKTYTGTPTGEIEVCVEATGAPTGVL
jgi:hypothetical protein